MIECNYNNIDYSPIVDEFIDYYGEENIDVQPYGIEEKDGIYIYIRWSHVTISNEYDEQHTIYDLFGRVKINNKLLLREKIKLTRTTYTEKEWDADYSHSHLAGINLGFKEPCFGSGPIISTMSHLMVEFNVNIWKLLCYELDKYVRVESVEGVPYRRLTSIDSTLYSESTFDYPYQLTMGLTHNNHNDFYMLDGAISKATRLTRYAINLLNKASKEIEKYFSFVKVDNHTIVEFDIYKHLILISNLFIKYGVELVNEKIWTESDFNRCFLKCKLNVNNPSQLVLPKNNDHRSYDEDRVLLTFKNIDYHLKIIEKSKLEDYYLWIIDPYIVATIIRQLEGKFNINDFHYGNSGEQFEINKESIIFI